MNITVPEAGSTHNNPWVHTGWTSNMYYTNNIPIPRKDTSEDSSKSDTNTNNSNNEGDVPDAVEYSFNLLFRDLHNVTR